MKSSKGQISIFIIISVIIISAMVFLVFMSNDSKKEEISRGTDVDTQERVLFIKQYVDSCMEKQLEKALIVSGLKGGFIYGVSNGTYRRSFIYPEPYPFHFIENIGLHPVPLGWNLVHARELWIGFTVPYLTAENVNKSIYNETVKSHFERYLFEEFGKNCQHNIESIEHLGFDFVNKDFSGKLESGLPRGDSQVIVKDLDGEVGDRVMFKLDDETYTGTINETRAGRIYMVKLDRELMTSNIDISEITVFNLNSTATVNVSFNKDETEMKFLYPILLNDSSRDSVVFVESVVSVPVRFGALRFLSQGLMDKKMDNRSINLSNSTQLNNILRSISKVRAFIDNLSELTFKIHKINDSPEYKEYVYYFFDNGSKILGNPYVYRFGYRNHAPSFNLSVLCVNDNIEDECILAYVADNGSWWNSTINISARMDPEVMDCRPKGYYSSEDSGDCGDVRYVDLKPADIFNLSTQGNYTFKAELEGKYPFEIQLTDGEAYTIREVYFIVGTPANFNNNDVLDCIKFYNYEKPGFPIESDLFKTSNGEGKIFTNVSGGRTKAYAYALYPWKYGIEVLDSCFGDPNNNHIEYWINDNYIEDHRQGFLFNVSTSSIPQEIKIQINDPNGNAINKENYTLTVYPSKCLGPHAAPDNRPNPWFMTCCNTEVLNKSIYDEGIRGSLIPNSKIYFEENGFALNEDVYFCYEPSFNSQDSPGHLGYDRTFHTQNIFGYSGSNKVTSLLAAHTEVICDGTNAIGNLSSIGGGVRGRPSFPSNTFVTGFGRDREIDGGLVNPGIFASFEIKQSADTCNFCYIPRKSNFVIKLDESNFQDYVVHPNEAGDIILTTGVARHNGDGEMNTLGILEEKYENRVVVRCIDDVDMKFGCADNIFSDYLCDLEEDTRSSPFPARWTRNVEGGKWEEEQRVFMGEKFCRLDGECDVRDMPGFAAREQEDDIKIQCRNSTGHPIPGKFKGINYFFQPLDTPPGGGKLDNDLPFTC